MKTIKYFISILIMILIIQANSYSQVLISNTSDSPHESAMLEIRSTTQGILIPRMSSANRVSISNPQPGLLVYDSDLNSFYIYGNSTWLNLSDPANMWTRKDTMVYLSQPNYNLGIGTTTPNRKLVIQADNDSDTLLEILNQDGYPLMVITPKLTKFNFVEDSKGIAGGFAIGRYNQAKDKALVDTTIFLVTPDSTRVYTSGASGVAGGFAVGRYYQAKDGKEPYISKYFLTDIDSTRVYTKDDGKGVSGGFAVGRYFQAKSTTEKFAHFTRYNSFIGFQAGNNTSTGQNNIFIGENSGVNNTTGSNNVFIGNQSGSNAIQTSGSGNVFIGNQAGTSTLQNNKLFINNGAADLDNALIYGDFTNNLEKVYLNGNLRFNRGTNSITMPTSRGNNNDVLTIGPGGLTDWEDVSNLITIPEPYVEPKMVVNFEGDFTLSTDDNIGTLVEKTSGTELVKEYLPLIDENYDRTIKIKNDRSNAEAYVFPISSDVIEGGFTNETPLILQPGETYTFQAGVDKETGLETWFIIDYTSESLESINTLMKSTATDYNFNTDGDGPKVYTLVIISAEVNNVLLPLSTDYPNRIIVVKNAIKEGTGKASVYPNGADLIDGSSSPISFSGNYESFMLQSDGGGNWFIINHTP